MKSVSNLILAVETSSSSSYQREIRCIAVQKRAVLFTKNGINRYWSKTADKFA